MYNNHSNRDPLVVAITAALGAGVATSFAICRGYFHRDIYKWAIHIHFDF